jgi:hypothetical protein
MGKPKGKESEMAMTEALRAKAAPRSGLVRAVLYLEPEQLAALIAEAQRRAAEKCAIRADASAVAREALAAWLKKRRK